MRHEELGVHSDVFGGSVATADGSAQSALSAPLQVTRSPLRFCVCERLCGVCIMYNVYYGVLSQTNNRRYACA